MGLRAGSFGKLHPQHTERSDSDLRGDMGRYRPHHFLCPIRSVWVAM
jgi:hypothetical protein